MRTIYTILGRAGSGKTHLAKRIAKHMPMPLVVLDTMDEYDDGLIFYRFDALLDWLTAGKLNNTRAYILKTTSDHDRDSLLRFIHLAHNECTLMLDEASKLCRPGWIHPDLNALIEYGRHWRVNIIASARRPVELHPSLRAQSDCIISFKQTEANDIEWIRKIYPSAEAVRTLDFERHEYMVFGDVRREPMREFFNSDPLAIFDPI